jgi:hypothetical protein
MARRPDDRPGPQPARRRDRQELQGPRRGLIGLLAGVAALALAGGIALLAGADLLGRPDELPIQAPVPSFRGAGILLLVVIGGSQAMAAWLLVHHDRRARAAALVAALCAVAWSVGQLLLQGGMTTFQLAMFGVGALEAFLLAGCTPRKPAGTKKRRGRT